MIDDEPAEPWSVVRMAAVCEGGLLLAALTLGWFVERPPLAQIVWNPRDALVGLVAAVPLWLGLVVMTVYPRGPFRGLNRITRQLIVPLFRGCRAWQLALVSLLAGVCEEALFRGAIQAAIQQVLGSAWLALLLASVLFGLGHAMTRTYAVVAGLVGAYLGGLWLATDNLLTPIVTHAVYDFVALVYLLRRGKPGEVMESSDRFA